MGGLIKFHYDLDHIIIDLSIILISNNIVLTKLKAEIWKL